MCYVDSIFGAGTSRVTRQEQHLYLGGINWGGCSPAAPNPKQERFDEELNCNEIEGGSKARQIRTLTDS